MAQIHEMAAQVYENQKLIEQLEAHPKFAAAPRSRSCPVRVPEDVDGDALPDGDGTGRTSTRAASSSEVLDGDDRCHHGTSTRRPGGDGEALVRLEPAAGALRELAQGAGKENNRLLEEDRPRHRHAGPAAPRADDERKPVRRGDRRRSGRRRHPSRANRRGPRRAAARKGVCAAPDADRPPRGCVRARKQPTRRGKWPRRLLARRSGRRGDEDEAPRRLAIGRDEDEAPSRRPSARVATPPVAATARAS